MKGSVIRLYRHNIHTCDTQCTETSVPQYPPTSLHHIAITSQNIISISIMPVYSAFESFVCVVTIVSTMLIFQFEHVHNIIPNHIPCYCATIVLGCNSNSSCTCCHFVYPPQILLFGIGENTYRHAPSLPASGTGKHQSVHMQQTLPWILKHAYRAIKLADLVADTASIWMCIRDQKR